MTPRDFALVTEALAKRAKFEAAQRAADAAEEAALDAARWPRWRCRLGWHRPVAVISGNVTRLGFVTRYGCGGRCGAWWLEDGTGRSRQDR